MKIIFIMVITVIFMRLAPESSLAFDRDAIVAGARTAVNANWSYVNTITNAVNAGPVMVGSADKNLPAYQQISQITAQIQALKWQMKHFSGK